MGCNLHVQVCVENYHCEKADEIAATLVPYPFADLTDGTMSAEGEVGFYGGQSPETFTRDLTHAIWKANGGQCDVMVRVDEPMEYELTDDDYAQFAADQPEGWEYEEDEEEVLA
jgi:hypothetical protein